MALLLELPCKSVGVSSTPDISGHGYDGTLSPGSGVAPVGANGPRPWMGAIRTNEYEIPGVGWGPSYVTCPSGASPQNTFCLMMWVRLLTVRSRNCLWSLTHEDGTASLAPWIEIQGDKLHLSTPGVLRMQATLPAGHDPTIWHHYAWDRAGTANSVAYLDSTPLSTEVVNDTDMSTTKPTLIGLRFGGGPYPQLASLADFSDIRVHDAAVGQAGVRKAYCASMRGCAALLGGTP